MTGAVNKKDSLNNDTCEMEVKERKCNFVQDDEQVSLLHSFSFESSKMKRFSPNEEEKSYINWVGDKLFLCSQFP